MRKRLFGGVVSIVALAIVLGPSPLRADIGTLHIGTSYSSITDGGSFDVSTWNGTSLQYLYCIDVHDYISPGGDYTNTSATTNGHVTTSTGWFGSVVAGQIAFLLDNYGVAGQNTSQVVALQEAIWKTIYGRSFDYGSPTTPEDTTAKGYYDLAVASKAGNVGAYLWFSPNTGDTTIHQAEVGKVPEPTSIVLLGAFLGAGLLGFAAKRRLS